jgi:hypothetical protein
VVEGAPEVVVHSVQQESVGEEAHHLADPAAAHGSQHFGDLRMQQRLATHDLEDVDSQVLGHQPALPLDIGGGQQLAADVGRHVAAVCAAQVAMLDHVELEGLDPDASLDAFVAGSLGASQHAAAREASAQAPDVATGLWWRGAQLDVLGDSATQPARRS